MTPTLREAVNVLAETPMNMLTEVFDLRPDLRVRLSNFLAEYQTAQRLIEEPNWTFEPPSRGTEIERTPLLTEASVAFLLEHQGYRCTMASLTIRGRLEVIERQARSQPASEPSLDVERLARAVAMVNLGYHEVGTASRLFAEQIAAEYQRLSQPADNEAATTPESR